MPTETRTDAVAMMAERLEHAVETDGSVDLLENWLQGFDLPPLGVEEEPYVWIMRGLSETVDRVQCERALAIWLAEWFRRKPDVERRGEYPDQVLYNAFFLAAGLASPDELAGSLLEMYERRQLSGDHLGIDHRGSLRSALSQNQLDARLEPVWRAMATGKETDFLPGNPYNGFEALAMMPDPVKGRGHPALEALGEALTYLSRKLDDQPRLRERRFERLLTRLCGLYPGLERAILGHLAHVAAEEGWSTWATDLLLNVSNPLPVLSFHYHTLFVDADWQFPARMPASRWLERMDRAWFDRISESQAPARALVGAAEPGHLSAKVHPEIEAAHEYLLVSSESSVLAELEAVPINKALPLFATHYAHLLRLSFRIEDGVVVRPPILPGWHHMGLLPACELEGAKAENESLLLELREALTTMDSATASEVRHRIQTLLRFARRTTSGPGGLARFRSFLRQTVQAVREESGHW